MNLTQKLVDGKSPETDGPTINNAMLMSNEQDS